MISLSSVLQKSQREEINFWYVKCQEALFPTIIDDPMVCLQKIKKLMKLLLESRKIDLGEAKINKAFDNYSAVDYIYAFSNNCELNNKVEPNTTRRENYYLFILASYIILWFNGASFNDISSQYGDSIYIIYKIAACIINEYQYPFKES